jgi:hypothetical protein
MLTEENIREHIPVLRLLGLLDPSMDPRRLYYVARTVSTDSVVVSRNRVCEGERPVRSDYASEKEYFDAVLYWNASESLLVIVEEMTPRERAELSERTLRRESKRKTPWERLPQCSTNEST